MPFRSPYSPMHSRPPTFAATHVASPIADLIDALDAQSLLFGALPPSSAERAAAALTAPMAAARSPCTSSASTPAIVVPPGEHTMSLSCAHEGSNVGRVGAGLLVEGWTSRSGVSLVEGWSRGVGDSGFEALHGRQWVRGLTWQAVGSRPCMAGSGFEALYGRPLPGACRSQGPSVLPP